MANIVTKPEGAWLKKSIDTATEFAERHREWAETMAGNWKQGGRESRPDAHDVKFEQKK